MKLLLFEWCQLFNFIVLPLVQMKIREMAINCNFSDAVQQGLYYFLQLAEL
jgi:hypothetical protein